MIELPELETVKTPDGEIYEITALPVESMPLLLDFIEIRQEMLKMGKKRDTKKGKGTKTKDEKMVELSVKKALPAANKLIDVATISTKTGKPLPNKYRTNRIIMKIADEIVVATNRGEVTGDGDPLTEVEKKSSE